MVMKEIIFNSFSFSNLLWKGVVVLRELIFNILYLERCGCLERTDF